MKPRSPGQRSEKKTALDDAKFALQDAKARAADAVDFEPLIVQKENRNINGEDNILPGLGAIKLRKLQEVGIHSARQLIQCDTVEYYVTPIGHLIDGLVDLAVQYFATLEDTVSGFELSLVTAELEYQEAVAALDNHLNGREPGDGTPLEPLEDESNTKPPLFKKGYNGLVLSKYRLDSIVITVFNHRKDLLRARCRA